MSRDALTRLCAGCGLDPIGAELVRNVNNAVFRLPAHAIVMRLVTLPSYVFRADVAVRAATRFAEHGIPAVRLLPGLDQPVRVGELVATVWQEVPDDGPTPTGWELARLLRSVHALPVDAEHARGPLPEWDPVGDFRNRLADAAGLAADDRAFLARRADELEAALAGVEFALPRTVLHGDAHLGNLIASPAGAVLCDFDSCSVGPAEWDLVPMAVSAVRFGRHAGQAELAAGYGFDVSIWPGFEVLRGIRDLKIVAGVFPRPGSGDPAAAELRRRMESLRAGRVSQRWTRVH